MKQRYKRSSIFERKISIPVTHLPVIADNSLYLVQANALAPEPLMLSDENSLWGSDLYIAVSKEVPQAENIRISGTFLTKAFEGLYKNTGKWVKEMKAYVKAKGSEIKKMYFFYTTCPACAKVYGKNYTVILVEV